MGLSCDLNQNKIKRLLSPFVLRRTKADVLKDLPKLFEQTIDIEMDEKQALIYQKLIEKAKNEPTHHFSLISQLRLCALDARLVDESHDEPSSKTWQIIEDIETIVSSKQKVIVFSQFTKYLQLLKQHLNEKGLEFAYLDGQTQNRDKPLEDFKGSSSIFLMSLKAGGVGLNLQQADYVLIADPWWNQASEKQAIDRAYRLGREAPVVARRYLTLGSLESKIFELKAHKWALLEDMTSLSDKDLGELLEVIFTS